MTSPRRTPLERLRPRCVGGRGWLGVYLDALVDWDEIGDIVVDAYRMVAPGRCLAALDAAT